MQPDAPATPLPEAPASVLAPVETPQGVPVQHVVMIQGKPFVRFAGLLPDRPMSAAWWLSQPRGPTTMVSCPWRMRLPPSRMGAASRRAGDASPANVTRKVAVHFRRVALTRAKARVLRDALGVDLVAVEELAEE